MSAAFAETIASSQSFSEPISKQFYSRTFQLCAILLLWACIYGPGLFQPSLFDDADAAHADAGREMLTRHDWVTLHENGIRYLEKAPLPYWAMAVSLRLFGVSEFSA